MKDLSIRPTDLEKAAIAECMDTMGESTAAKTIRRTLVDWLPDQKRIADLEAENEQLKQQLADYHKGVSALQAALGGIGDLAARKPQVPS